MWVALPWCFHEVKATTDTTTSVLVTTAFHIPFTWYSSFLAWSYPGKILLFQRGVAISKVTTPSRARQVWVICGKFFPIYLWISSGVGWVSWDILPDAQYSTARPPFYSRYIFPAYPVKYQHSCWSMQLRMCCPKLATGRFYTQLVMLFSCCYLRYNPLACRLSTQNAFHRYTHSSMLPTVTCWFPVSASSLYLMPYLEQKNGD